MTNNLNKLIEALRGDNYIQTIGQLRKDNSFCWAGVACDIVNPLSWDNGEYEGSLWVMPDSVQSFYGFQSPIGGFVGSFADNPFYFESLSAMNDGGCDFQKIADTIQWGWENNRDSEMFI